LSLERYAIEIGLDVARFHMELATRAHRDRVLEDIASGEESGVAWTPTFFINDVRFGYAPNLDGLLEALRTAAEEATRSPRRGSILPRGVVR
jgi:predicted DsbA family dithiol-disulfide isomerase